MSRVIERPSRRPGPRSQGVRAILRVGWAVLVLGAPTGCSPDAASNEESASPTGATVDMSRSGAAALEIEAARALLMEDSGAIYLTLHNRGAEPLSILGFRSDVSAAVSLHETSSDDDGMMRMKQIEGPLVLEAGESLEMAPGGLHLMLDAPDAPASGVVAVQIDLAGGDTVEVEAEVSSPADLMDEHHDH